MLVGQPQRIDRRVVFVAESDAVVEGTDTQYQRDPFGVVHPDGDFVVTVADFAIFTPGLCPGFVVLRGVDLVEAESRGEVHPVGLESQLRGLEQGLSVDRDGQGGNSLLVQRHGGADAAVGRGDGGVG